MDIYDLVMEKLFCFVYLREQNNQAHFNINLHFFSRQRGIPDVPPEQTELCYGTSPRMPRVMDWFTEFLTKYKDRKHMLMAFVNWCLSKCPHY